MSSGQEVHSLACQQVQALHRGLAAEVAVSLYFSIFVPHASTYKIIVDCVFSENPFLT